MIPRWGVHYKIKYSTRRSLLKICPQCDKLFTRYKKGYRIYCCDVCRANAHREQKRRIDKKIHEKGINVNMPNKDVEIMLKD
jgi:hypothetical protein